MKVCTGCKESKPLFDFYKSKSHADGYSFICKPCDTKRRHIRTLNKPDTHLCLECHEELPKSSFYAGRASCKSCVSKKTRSYRTSNKDIIKKSSYKAKLKSRYGLNQEQLDDLKIKAEFKCQICKEEEVELVIDHNHDTGKVRGMLCRYCNLALGHFKDSLERLESAINYLKENDK